MGRANRRGRASTGLVGAGVLAMLAAWTIGAGATSARAGSTVYSDGDFPEAEWTVEVLIAGAFGTGTWSRQETGGNPDAYVEHTIDVLPETAVAILATRDDALYDPAASGAIGAIDYSEDARLASGAFGQFSYPLVEQGGVRYLASGILTGETEWTAKSLPGLTASDFARLDETNLVLVLDDHPDFGPSAASIRFGYARLFASEAAETNVADIDNWRIEVESVGSIGVCGPGAVNAACGPREDVLLLNGGAGGTEREIALGQDDPLSVTIQEPASGIGDGRDRDAVVYVWAAVPGPSDVVTLPRQLGTMCFGPFVSATVAPARIWNSIGIQPKLGTDDGPGPEPQITDGEAFELLSLPSGLGRPLSVTFQGILEDVCSQGTVPYSVTNGFVLVVN